MMEKLGQAKTHLELKKMMRRWTKLTQVREGRRRIEKKINLSSLQPRSQAVREKWPGNLHEFKLLLPLPESWRNQSDFRSLSHENSN